VRARLRYVGRSSTWTTRRRTACRRWGF